jgi:hypothetical protein
MGRQCSICSHDEREAIDHLLVQGKPYREIAARYGFTLSSLSRHRRAHLSPALARIHEACQRDADHSASLVDRVEGLIARTEKLLSRAEQSGAVTTALAAVRELRGLTELYGKASGELDDRPQVTINLLACPEWLAVRAALFAALAEHPAARAAVAGRLLELEAGPS